MQSLENEKKPKNIIEVSSTLPNHTQSIIKNIIFFLRNLVQHKVTMIDAKFENFISIS